MAAIIMSGQALSRVLVELEMLPEETVDVELMLPVDGVMQMRYTVNLTKADFEMISEAFKLLAERMK